MITIHHNPACGTSRNTLELIRIVVTRRGVRSCRPAEKVLDILPESAGN